MEQRLRSGLDSRGATPGITSAVTPTPDAATPVPSEPTPHPIAGKAAAVESAHPPAPTPARVASVPRRAATTKKRDVSRPKTAPPGATDAGMSALDRRVAEWYRKGLAAKAQGRYLEAVQAFEKAKAEDTYKESELYYTIEDELQRAIEQLHARARPLVAEADRLESAGRFTEARQKLADAVSKDPYYAPAVTRLRQLEERLVSNARKVLLDAQAKEKEGDVTGAAAAYRKVLALVPDPSNVYHQTATRRLEQLE